MRFLRSCARLLICLIVTIVSDSAVASDKGPARRCAQERRSVHVLAGF